MKIDESDKPIDRCKCQKNLDCAFSSFEIYSSKLNAIINSEVSQHYDVHGDPQMAALNSEVYVLVVKINCQHYVRI